MSSKADDLKRKFVTGAVLKEVDFSDLIGLADDSLIKLGLTSDFPESLPGLENTSKQLALKVGDGLEINPQNNQVQAKIKPNAGIEATADGLALKTDPNGGLNLDQAGLLINYGDGLKLDGYADESKLSVNANTGLIVNASGIQVNLATESGLELGDHGLKVKVDQKSKYLTLSENGLDLSEAGKLLLEQSGNRTFIQAIENVRNKLAEGKPINFPKLETTLEKGGQDIWGRDIYETIDKALDSQINYSSEFYIKEFLNQQRAIPECIPCTGFHFKISSQPVTGIPSNFKVSININAEPKDSSYPLNGEENGEIKYNLYYINKNNAAEALSELFKGDYSSTQYVKYLDSKVVTYKISNIINDNRETSAIFSGATLPKGYIYMAQAKYKIKVKTTNDEDTIVGTITFVLDFNLDSNNKS